MDGMACIPLELDDVHGCGCVWRRAVEAVGGIRMGAEAKVTAWLSLVLRCAFDVGCLLVLLSVLP